MARVTSIVLLSADGGTRLGLTSKDDICNRLLQSKKVTSDILHTSSILENSICYQHSSIATKLINPKNKKINLKQENC